MFRFVVLYQINTDIFFAFIAIVFYLNPNIIGGISPDNVNEAAMDCEFSGTGAFRCPKGTIAAAGSSSKFSGFVGFTFDASRSNAAYSKSTTVQPKALQILIIIKA